MRLSVVVPALNEAAGIVATLQALAPLRAAGHEVIVVDGGSSDGTATLAAPQADQVLASARFAARVRDDARQLDVLVATHRLLHARQAARVAARDPGQLDLF